MRDTLLALWELQKIDSRVHEFELAAAELPIQIRELEKGLDAGRNELGTLRTELEQKRSEQHTAEAQIQDEGAKLQKWKRRLNEIKTPREYQALSREVEQTERQIRDTEEQVLVFIGEIEAKQKLIAEKEAAFKEVEADVNAKVKALRTKQIELNRGAQDAKAGRDAMVAKISPRAIKLYDSVRKRRQGSAVAMTQKGACTGCHVMLRPQQLVEVRKLNSLEQCPQCNRILILDSLVAPPDGDQEQSSEAQA